jgi:2-polyprenyl-3-methyl-5-hydroxy-6-metoxy-1,4-benzoquinol methylase
MADLAYETLEPLRTTRPVERVGFMSSRCRGKRVLDIGCLDETALEKRDTEEWLHRRIGAVAQTVIGIDLSDRLPHEGLVTGPNSRIMKGDGTNPDIDCAEIDIIIAGEFIEHIPNPLDFLSTMRARYPGREMLLSTPNGTSFANALLGTIGREAQHQDHLMTSTYKTLNTLCRRAGCRDWDIIPYRFYATEMLLQTSGAKRIAVRAVEAAIRLYERLFPLRSFGYVVRMTL